MLGRCCRHLRLLAVRSIDSRVLLSIRYTASNNDGEPHCEEHTLPEPDDPRDEHSGRRPYVSPLRDRRAQQTRDEILDALTRLLEAHGADEITTQELARAAGVSQRTVYRHFPDRAALVEALTARLVAVTGRGPVDPTRLEDLKPVVIKLMADLEAHQVEARAEAIFNADPRRYATATREHTRRFGELVAVSLPELDEKQQHGVAAIARVLVSAQTWLRLREELGIGGEASGPLVAWVLDALVHEVHRGNPPPS
jgi:AcrR family transcriptional regulator